MPPASAADSSTPGQLHTHDCAGLLRRQWCRLWHHHHCPLLLAFRFATPIPNPSPLLQKKAQEKSFAVPHATLSHVSPVSLFVAWIIAILRERDFKKLQKQKKASVRREVTGEAIQGEVAFLILCWCLVMLLKSGHITRQHWRSHLSGLELISKLNIRRKCFPGMKGCSLHAA